MTDHFALGHGCPYHISNDVALPIRVCRVLIPWPTLQISDHLTWAGSAAARHFNLRHACYVTWPLFMLEEAGLLPARSLRQAVFSSVHALRSSRLAPRWMRPPGPPRALLDNVRKHCLGDVDGRTEGAKIVLVATSFGLEAPRSLPPTVRVIGRGARLETARGLADHAELKVQRAATAHEI